MENKEITKQIEKKEAELKKLKEKLKIEETKSDYKKITYKNKEFRIYIWENRPVKDFINNMPKGFRLSEFQEFNELIEDEFELEIYKEYFVKHFNKTRWNKKYNLSVLYRGGDLDLGAGVDDLADSYSGGRVVVVRDLK